MHLIDTKDQSLTRTQPISQSRSWNTALSDKDTKSIGTIMMELMEPATSILDPDTTTLVSSGEVERRIGDQGFLSCNAM